ncbi:MAG: roadblock/LC7 domain-containing protein [Nevskiaceae bacterium]|jgi:predicted regulator of Ras-like GTPase activity (Roadblock/LC7/MglB family)|nr:roadblock/LC7 domain-containing protein [Nevskiaceae bacterium]
MSKQEQLQSALERMNRSIGGLKGSLLSTLDGMPIVQVINDQSVEAARVAAMSATALGVGRRIAETLKTGQLRELSLQASDGRIFMYLVGTKACLSLVAPLDCNVGLISIEVGDTIAQLADVL